MDFQLVDVNEENIITFDYNENDLVNPTIIKTPYSKSIVIPFTKKNNETFGYYFKTDKILTNGDINPNVRIPYQITYNNEPIQFGYLQLTNIDEKGYEITLYSDIGALLRDASEDRLVDVVESVPFRVNKNTINQLMTTYPLDTTLDPQSQSRYLWWYSFTPTYQGKYKNFTNNKLLKDNGTTVEIEEVDEHDIMELRSYYQKPGIYYNKIIKNIATKYHIELDTDFHNNTNPYWNQTVMLFNNLHSNKITDTTALITFPSYICYEHSYFYNNLMRLNSKLDNKANLSAIADTYNIITSNQINLTNYPLGQCEIEYQVEVKLKGQADYTGFMAGVTHWQIGPYIYSGQVNPIIQANFDKANTIIESYVDGQINNTQKEVFGLKRFTIPGSKANVISFDTPNGDGSDSFFTSTGEYANFHMASNNGYTNSPSTKTYIIRGKSIIINDGTPRRLNIKIKYEYAPNPSYLNQFGAIYNPGTTVTQPQWTPNLKLRLESVAGTSNKITINAVPSIRSNYIIDKNNIIPSDINCGDILLNHIKRFGLILHETKEGNIKISTRNTFYTNSGILDWNDKLCNDKNIELKPILHNSKFYKMKYRELPNTHTEEYKNRFGSEIGFGEMMIDTSYQFGETEPKIIYEDLATQPMISQEYGIYEYNNVLYNFRYNQCLPSLSSIDGAGKRSSLDINYSLYFRDTYNTLPHYQTDYPIYLSETQPNYYIITDDAPSMTSSGEYYWVYNWKIANGANITDNSIKTKLKFGSGQLAGYPYLGSITKDGKFSLDFGKPKQYYYNISDAEYNNEGTLYNRFYKNYINDRYNINTKVLTAYFTLTQKDINDIKYNKFIYLFNNYWVIDKIYEFRFDNKNEPTKVTLVKVNDLTNYKSGQKLN